MVEQSTDPDQSSQQYVIGPDDTLHRVPSWVKRRLAAFLRPRTDPAAAAPIKPATCPQPPMQVPPGSSPKAVAGGCEFCPSLGGGCIVCADWD
jgi:hypothetical protein